MNVLLFGAPKFFVPRLPPPILWPPGSVQKASYYDNSQLRPMLERLVDFDRINGGQIRFSVGAVDICSGNFTYFDTTTHESGSSTSSPAAHCRPAFRRPKSTASSTGTAG